MRWRIRTTVGNMWRVLHAVGGWYVGRDVEPGLRSHLREWWERSGRMVSAVAAVIILWFWSMVDHVVDTCLGITLGRWLRIRISRRSRRGWTCSCRDGRLHMIPAINSSRLCWRRYGCLRTMVRRSRLLLCRLLRLPARLCLGFLNITHGTIMPLLNGADLANGVVAIPRVQTRHKLRY